MPFFSKLTSARAFCFGIFGFLAGFAGAVFVEVLAGACWACGVYAGYTYSSCPFAGLCRWDDLLEGRAPSCALLEGGCCIQLLDVSYGSLSIIFYKSPPGVWGSLFYLARDRERL